MKINLNQDLLNCINLNKICDRLIFNFLKDVFNLVNIFKSQSKTNDLFQDLSHFLFYSFFHFFSPEPMAIKNFNLQDKLKLSIKYFDI